ncbi:hypothetical protein E2C01_058423 [Portunus trituberculatus]|uniref:Uncharacterized protein n=1 Tax=Portunus trituberculatus TaxID=210409 RepID=A0A5B7GVI5_PORTR|nr:hypothetical protein [Portunus trituberculatus]
MCFTTGKSVKLPHWIICVGAIQTVLPNVVHTAMPPNLHLHDIIIEIGKTPTLARKKKKSPSRYVQISQPLTRGGDAEIDGITLTGIHAPLILGQGMMNEAGTRQVIQM